MARIIDSHIHMYPPEAAADPKAWGLAHGEPGWVRCVAPDDRASIQGWATVDQLLADMDRAGVERCVMLGWYWQYQDTCELQNAFYERLIRDHPDRLSAFAAVQPKAGDRALAHVSRMLDAGFVGIGEMLPQAQGFTHGDPDWHRLIQLAIHRNVPLNLHVSDPVVIDPSIAPATPLEEIVSLVDRFSAARFILAHWGGGLPFYELNPRVRRSLRNVVYDTSASPLIYDGTVFRRVIELVGHERIVFGSDYPLCLYPRKSGEPDMERFLEAVAAGGLSESEREAVMGANIQRWLGL